MPVARGQAGLGPASHRARTATIGNLPLASTSRPPLPVDPNPDAPRAWRARVDPLGLAQAKRLLGDVADHPPKGEPADVRRRARQSPGCRAWMRVLLGDGRLRAGGGRQRAMLPGCDASTAARPVRLMRVSAATTPGSNGATDTTMVTDARPAPNGRHRRGWGQVRGRGSRETMQAKRSARGGVAPAASGDPRAESLDVICSTRGREPSREPLRVLQSVRSNDDTISAPSGEPARPATAADPARRAAAAARVTDGFSSTRRRGQARVRLGWWRAALPMARSCWASFCSARSSGARSGRAGKTVAGIRHGVRARAPARPLRPHRYAQQAG